MRGLLFMNRFALICNLCFLTMFILQDVRGLDQYQIVVSTILVLAISSFIINIVTLVVCTISYLIRKKVNFPKFLFIINFGFFLLQFYHFLISN
jgi:hypothetical protein